MVNGPTLKTGWWRTNPDGTRTWIEQSNQPKKPGLEGIEPVAEIEVAPSIPVEEPPIEPLAPLLEAPIVEIEDIATAYNLPTGKFVTPEELGALLIPPEERIRPLVIPYEQYLTWEQARWLGFDVPEGSVVKMVPMVEGEPQFFIMPSPEVIVERAERLERERELIEHIREPYARMFDPAASWGFSIEEIPAMVVQQLRLQMTTDYAGFVEDLYDRVDPAEAENILRLLGVTEEYILLTLGFKEQEARVNTLIIDVFPDFDTVDKFTQLLEEDWELFVETIQTGGATAEKRALLQFMGYNPEEINGVFSVLRVVVPIDDVRRLVFVTLDDKAYNQEGQWVGRYNRDTKVFTPKLAPLTEKDRKAIFDQRMIDIAIEYADIADFTVRGWKERRVANPQRVKAWMDAKTEAFNEWKFGHLPEGKALDPWEALQVFGEGLTKLPRLLGAAILQAFQGQGGASVVDKDWADRFIEDAQEDLNKFITKVDEKFESRIPTELAQFPQNLAFSLTSMGAGLGVGAPIAFLPLPGARVAAYTLGTAASGLVAYQMTTYQIMQQYLELKDEEKRARTGSGLTQQEEDALKEEFSSLAHKYGLWEAIPEAISNLAFVTILTAPLTTLLGKKLGTTLAKSWTTKILSKITAMYGQELLTETITQKGQSAIEIEAGLREGRITWLEAFKEIAPQTFLLTTVMAGAGTTIVSTRNALMKTETSLQKEIGTDHPLYQRIWDNLKEAVRGEEGFAVPGEFLPGRPEEIRPARITKETWDATPVEQRVTQATDAGLEGKVGSKSFADLTTTEIDALSTIKPVIPTAEPGMPEAGLQPPLIPGVPAEEVRPRGKGEIVQISMEDQLKLDQARKAAEEAPDDVREAYESQAEIEGLRVGLETDPVAQYRIEETVKRKVKQPDGTYKLTQTTRRYGLDRFISIKEGTFPSYFTLKQAQAIKPSISVTPYSQPGTPLFNHVPIADALDELADKWGMTPDEIADRVMAIREEKRRIKTLEATIKTEMVEKPLTPRTELTTAEVTENWNTVGQPKLTLKQVDALTDVFAAYVLDPNTLKAIELTRALRSEELSKRFENLKARAQELIVGEGITSEQAIKQAISETMAGQLPGIRTDYLEGITGEMRDAHFAKVYHTFSKLGPQYQGEMMATVTALTNALDGKPIPRKKGTGSILFPEGGSAWDRLNYVFGKRPKVLKAIDKMAKEKKPLDEVMEGVFHEIGREPIPIDQKTAEYLRKLSDIPQGYKTLLEPEFNYPVVLDIRTGADIEFARADLELGTRFADGELTFDEFQLERTKIRDKAYPLPPITKYEVPIEKAIKEIPLWPAPVRDSVIKALKEFGMLPIDIGNFLRANKASFDMSFWRQQAPLIASHPISFAQANVDAWKALLSQKSAEASWEKITRDPLYQIYEFAAEEGGDFLRPLIIPKGTSQWRGTEEFGYLTGERLIPRLTSKIPWVKLSARAFETGTNVHNWLIFQNYHKAMLKLSEQYASGQKTLKAGQVFDIQKEMIDFAKSLANFTARGSLGRFSVAAPTLSSMFFAPRASIGRILSIKDLVNANPRVRREAWKNAALFVSTLGGIVLLGAAVGWWEVELDPRSAEYMSIRIGTTRIDPWGGFRQFLVFFTRVITGTGVSSVTGAEYEVNKLMAVTNFVRGKGSPLASIISDFWTGKTFVGEEVDVANVKQWIERVAPFAVWDIYEAYMEDPVTAFEVAIPAIVGAGVQTYTGDWRENWPKLGLPKYSENLQYGMTEPYYDTADFWADTAGQFVGVDPATLIPEKGFPDYIRAIAEARIINEHLSALPGQKLSNLNPDPAEGKTFADLRELWMEREKLVALGDEAEYKQRELQPDGKYKVVTYKGDDAVKAFDEKEITGVTKVTKQGKAAVLGNMSQRQFALLNQYWAITDPKEQAEFLEKHKADIGVNPRQDWLRSHPTENAQLAVWGQAKILTKEAYTEFNRLIKELDIPDNAIPVLTLPPETSIDTHFTYEEMVDAGTHSSVEAKLLLLKDHLAAEEAGVQSYVDWRTESGNPLTLSDESVEYLHLRVDNQDLYDALKEAMELPIKADRDAAADAVRDTKVGDETFRDIERRVDAMGKGTREAPIPDEVVNAYVKHMRIVDGTSGNSAEAKLNRYDNPDLNLFLMDEDVWGGQKAEALDENKEYLDNYLIPRWRIDVKYRTEDEEYDALETASERQDYLLEHLDYKTDRRRREALEMSNKVTGDRFPVNQIDNFIAYWELPVKGKRQERFLVENPEFADAMHNIAGIDIPKPEDVPVIQYDDIYDQFVDNFERLEGLADNESEFYIQDTEAREIARNALRFDGSGRYNEFGLAEIRRNAYGLMVQEQFIDSYVGYYKLIGEGKPENWKLNTGTDLWFDDDWFMMENIGFYQTVYRDLLGNEKWDFTKVPTREVFNLYLTYIALPHLKSKDDFRWENPGLDAWLVLKFDYTPIAEKKRRGELTTYERFLEEWEERGQAIEESLAALRE